MAKPKKGGMLERFASYKVGVEVTIEPCEDVPEPIEPKIVHYGSSKARSWEKCEECGNDVWYDHVQTQFYHKLACSKSNGIGYGKEMSKEPLVKHHIACECMCCSKDIGRRESIMAGGG